VRRRTVLFGLVGLALPGTARAEPPALTVFAASDLALAFREIGPRFETARGAKLTLVFGSTGNMARQIEHGAPADVFFAADQSFVDRLVAAGVLIPETRALYAQGRLVLATARAVGARLTEPRDLLDARVRHVAIANPLHAPYGKAAEQVLRRVGLWDAVRPKLVYGESVQHALQLVQAGGAQAGLVARSIAEVPEVEWTPIDPALHAPLDQAVAVVRRSPRPGLAAAFIQFVNGPEGHAIMTRHGFVLPGEL
jgi:molybdate transport system substrate-binding protein